MTEPQPELKKLTAREFEQSLKKTLMIDRIDHQNLSIKTYFDKVSIVGRGRMTEEQLLNLLESNTHVDIEKTTVECPFGRGFIINTEQKRYS